MANVGEGSVIHNAGSGVPNFKENAIKRAMFLVTLDQPSERFGVSKGSERSVNRANDFAQNNSGGRALQAIAALGTARALHQAGVFQVEQNQLQEFFRQALGGSYFPNLECALWIFSGKQHESLQGVETFLRYPHRFTRKSIDLIKSINLVDLLDKDLRTGRSKPSRSLERLNQEPRAKQSDRKLTVFSELLLYPGRIARPNPTDPRPARGQDRERLFIFGERNFPMAALKQVDMFIFLIAVNDLGVRFRL